ncbi:DUF72 domain-containing protein [Candidatus Margulisiibacteriota bacterium]
MKKSMLYIGTSGYNYDHWKENFYPKGLPQNKWLEYYQTLFSTVELNVTFYRLPQKKVFESWKKRTKKGFAFSLKGSRYITHIKRLKDPKRSLRIFFEQSKPLKSKTKVVLWQLPPNYKKDIKRLGTFLKELKKYKGYRNAFEFRNETWFYDEVYNLLKKHKATLCFADWPKLDYPDPTIFDYIYVRRHGPHVGALYTANYSNKDLKEDAKNIKKWLKAGKDIYFYFNNDAVGYAVKNALVLKKLTGS